MHRAITSVLAFSTFFLAVPVFAQSDMSAVRQQRFASRDRNGDGFLTQDEYGGHPGNFRALDRDGDNRLSRDEFVRRAGAGAGGAGTTVELPDEFAYLDLNADDVLTRSEWYGQPTAFDRVDRDDNGRVTREEFRNPPAADDRESRFYGRDANGDGVLSQREWRESGVAFHRADRNDDGVVSLREFLVLPAQADDDREARFDALDRNANGILERSEWRTNSPTFAQVDRNRNGVVTRWEFLNASASASTGDMDLTFEDMDHNNDGVLSRREWHSDMGQFDLADRNDDGLVTMREFVSGGKVLTSGSSASFNTLDTNRDGYLSRWEWSGTRESFVQRDRNGDGRLSRSEFQS